MSELKRVCVFCGSSSGDRPSFAAAAAALGTLMARHGLGLVYGGASVGLMGVLADAALREGGQVTGVITETLVDHEIAHAGLTRLDVVGSMHERKARMAHLSDAFIMLPGGFGTLEEFMEIVTWRQLGIHDKPTGMLNVDGYFDDLLRFVALAVDTGFVRPLHADRLAVVTDPEVLLHLVAQGSQPPTSTHSVDRR